MSNGITIIIDEEYGFRHWVWETGMTEEELIQWWVDMESVKPYYADLSGTLPGKVLPMENDGRFSQESKYIAHFHEDSDSSLFDRQKKEYIFHKGYDRQ